MVTALSENPDHVRYLCAQLAIGTPRPELSRVFGGFHHKVWRLETDCGTYAVKQLAADTDLGNPDTVNHYNVTEAIAEAFSDCGVAAIFALRSNAKYLQLIDNVGYLVHPWSDAVALDWTQISETHALQVARVLAKMHRADLVVPGLKEPEYDIHPEEKVIELVEKASECGLHISGVLQNELPAFLSIVEAHKNAIPLLDKHGVISHGDLDQKNVLWNKEGEPIIIDWESARKLNPTYEIVLEALDWSGIASRFNLSLFKKIIAEYQRAGGVIEHGSILASFHCILGDWLVWLMYNVGRSVYLEDAEQRLLGAEQVSFALATLLQLRNRLPELLSMSTGLAVASC